MSEEDLERTLRDAFAGRAQEAVGDGRPVPAPRFASDPATRRHRGRLLAPLAAAAAVVAVVGGILTLAHDTGSGSGGPVAGGRASSHLSASGFAPSSTAPGASDRPTSEPKSIHIRLFNGDGEVYGVAMPVVAIFSARVADARPFARATKITVDGKPTHAAWYFEESSAGLGAMEAHLRPAEYWPAHADIHVSI